MHHWASCGGGGGGCGDGGGSGLCVCVISLSFAHQLFQNTRKVLDFTYHSKRICFKEAKWKIFSRLHISILNGFGSALRNLAGFCHFHTLKQPSLNLR